MFWTWDTMIKGCYVHRDVLPAGTLSGTKRPWDGSSRHRFISTDVLSPQTFCLYGRFVPTDVLSLRMFCPYGRFVPRTLCLRLFCLLTFCLRMFCLRTFCLWTFCNFKRNAILKLTAIYFNYSMLQLLLDYFKRTDKITQCS
jgi:hypothetical protein